VLLIGMLSWALRYLCFMSPAFEAAIIGLLLHGFCYSFLYVGAYMYVDKRAPEDLKASAQSLLAFLLLGVGWFFGAQGAGLMKGWFPPDISSMAAVDAETGEAKDDAALPRWDDPKAATSAWRFLNLSGTVKGLMGEEQEEATPDLAQQLDVDKNGKITLAEIDGFATPAVTVDGFEYSKENLTATFKTAAEKLGLEGEVTLDREQWLEVQSNKWGPIWMWPSIICFAVLVLFAVAFREKKE